MCHQIVIGFFYRSALTINLPDFLIFPLRIARISLCALKSLNSIQKNDHVEEKGEEKGEKKGGERKSFFSKGAKNTLPCRLFSSHK